VVRPSGSGTAQVRQGRQADERCAAAAEAAAHTLPEDPNEEPSWLLDEQNSKSGASDMAIDTPASVEHLLEAGPAMADPAKRFSGASAA
jgi:hypothetical protein